MNRLSMKNQDVKYVEHFLNSMSRFDGTNIAKQLKKCEAYEDTGLEPEQIPEMSQMFREKCEEVNRYEKINQECIDTVGVGVEMMPLKFKEFIDDFNAFDNYRKLKEQGRLIELPKEFTDDVYYIWAGSYWRVNVSNIAEVFLKRDVTKFYGTSEEAENALAANEQDAKLEKEREKNE